VKIFKKFTLFFTAFCFIVLIFGCKKEQPQKDAYDSLNQAFEQYKKDSAQIEIDKNKYGADVLSMYDVLKLMNAQVPSNVKSVLSDKFYITLTERFISDSVGGETFQFLTKGSFKYKQDSFDCDDFALTAVVLARREHFHLTREDRPVTILFGEFYYIQDGGTEGHAINCFITPDKRVNFFEPQKNQIIHLTENEIKSCFFWKF